MAYTESGGQAEPRAQPGLEGHNTPTSLGQTTSALLPLSSGSKPQMALVTEIFLSP